MTAILVSSLIAKHSNKGIKLGTVLVMCCLMRAIRYMLRLVFKVVYLVIKTLWISSRHPIMAYLWVKLATICWALVLTSIADNRCKGSECIMNPECQIIIHAQSSTLREIHDSNFVAFLSILKMVSINNTFGDRVHACLLAAYAYVLGRNEQRNKF